MEKESRKKRLNPSKLLVLLLYGTYPYLEVEAIDGVSKRLTLHIGKFAKLMRVRKEHIQEYVSWLETMGFLVVTGQDRYHITVIVDIPLLFKDRA
jgi:hypothetical protein